MLMLNHSPKSKNSHKENVKSMYCYLNIQKYTYEHQL
jgi:hypothetical protein